MHDYGDMDIFELSRLTWRHRLRDRWTWHVRFLIRS